MDEEYQDFGEHRLMLEEQERLRQHRFETSFAGWRLWGAKLILWIYLNLWVLARIARFFRR